MKLRKLTAIFAISISMMLMSACGSEKVNETVSEIEEAADETEADALEGSETEDSAEHKETENNEEKEAQDNKKQAADEAEKSSGKASEANVEKNEETSDDSEETEEEDGINWEDIEELAEPVALYAQMSLNVRKGPDTTFDVLGALALNEEVSVIGESKSTPWKEIQYKGEKAFVHGGYLSEEPVDVEAMKAAQEAAVQAAAEVAAQAQTPETAPTPAQAQAQAPEAAPAPASAPQPQVDQPAGVLFIGDSRTCQMKSATGGAGCSWICEYAQSYDWFESTAVPQADKMIGQGTKVVICMGVNDPNNCNKYASLVNQKAGAWNARGAKVYFVSVNPTAQPYEDKNPRIDDFNANMPGLLSGVTWIDTASTVKQGGYLLVDGIHYDAGGNINIFNMICANLK